LGASDSIGRRKFSKREISLKNKKKGISSGSKKTEKVELETEVRTNVIKRNKGGRRKTLVSKDPLNGLPGVETKKGGKGRESRTQGENGKNR